VTVGAGGGSIARVEEGGVLRVGPGSAGASPGPACYGLGGEDATVTDAQVVLNRLDPDAPLSGEITLYPDRARKAVAEVAARLGDLDVLAMADGIVRLAVVRMASAIREVSVHRGENPRDFVLLAFGGAGPMVAAELARELGMTSVLVPPHPGNLSALGLLVSPLRRDLVQTRIARLADVDAPSLEAGLRELAARAGGELEGEGLATGAIEIQPAVDLRYVGQSFTLTVPLPPGAAEPRDLAVAFHAAHAATFGHAAPGEPVELVNLRISASLPAAPVRLQAGTETPAGTAAPARSRPVYFRGRLEPCPVHERRALGPGTDLTGPLLVEEPGSSTVVWSGDRLRVDARGNLRIEVADR
jgi:N-methylhydantoinase A